MDIGVFAELGQVTNVCLAGRFPGSDALTLSFLCANGERKTYPITDGAACMIWHYLTKHLFPRAAGVLTPRAATAVVRPGLFASTIFAVKVLPRGQEMIEIAGISALNGWAIYITREEAFELWACLDQALNLSTHYSLGNA